MRISFELDQTLLTTNDEFLTEEQNLFQRVLRFEKLRLGAVDLLTELRSMGHEVWIYTSSNRPRHYIHELFLRHSIEISGIVNRKNHMSNLETDKRALSKYPPAFNIDYHVDHAENVKMDGVVFGFKTIIVNPSENNWVDNVKREILNR